MTFLLFCILKQINTWSIILNAKPGTNLPARFEFNRRHLVDGGEAAIHPFHVVFPGNVFAVVRFGSTHEKHSQRQNAAMSFDPFFVHSTTYRGNRHTDLVRNLFHLERLEKFSATIKKLFLMVDDFLGHSRQRASSLLNRFDQPLS